MFFSQLDNEFQDYCSKIISKLTNDDLRQCLTIKNDMERITFIAALFGEFVPIVLEPSGKDITKAQNYREQGNTRFITKNYKESIDLYNVGIRHCPRGTDEEREMYALLIANRSASLFELKEYQLALEDINYIISLNCYPKNLLHKVMLRKARCCRALGLSYDFKVCYQLLKRYNELDETSYKIQRDRITRLSREPITVLQPNLVPSTLTGPFEPHDIWMNAHKNLGFEIQEGYGKYAIANEDFNVGDIIVKEDAYCMVLLGKMASKNCHYCFKSLINPISCPKCCYTVYCINPQCYNNSFHKNECKILGTLYRVKVSVNCLMALRMITQHPLKFFLERQKYLEVLMCADRPPDTKPYASSDYLAAFNLCGNNESVNLGQYVFFSAMALYMVDLLKLGGYFNGCELRETELFIAALLVHHLNILQFNSHEVAEMIVTHENVYKEVNFTNKCIGGGLFPTVARFNHACDPSVIRYNIGRTMIVEAIKPIKSGEIIYENYGPLYTEKIKAERQDILLQRYLFECNCRPCVENWPTLSSLMDERNDNPGFIISCKTFCCPYGYLCNFSTTVMSFVCELCDTKNNLLPVLLKLAKLKETSARADELFESGFFMEAEKIYKKLLTTLFENVKMPCMDALVVQQKLKYIAVMKGNKRFQFQSPQLQ